RQLALTEENLKQFLASPHRDGDVVAPLNRVMCAAGDIVREASTLVGPSLRHRRIEFSAVDKTDGNDQLNADPSHLRQLLINLADAAGPGGKVKVEIEAGEHVNQVILSVLDNGPGPPAEILPRLFEPFATSKPEGVGLGLAVAQQIVTAHGGQIVFHRAGGE